MNALRSSSLGHFFKNAPLAAGGQNVVTETLVAECITKRFGEVTALDERDVTIEIADRTRIKVLRTHVAGMDQPSEEKS